MNNKKIARVAAVLGAFALSTAAVAGGATAAMAAPAGFGNIDFTAPSSLTVHKYLHQASGGAVGDISSAPAAGAYTDPVKDVVFTAYPLLKSGVALDLTVPATWNSLNAIVPGAGCTVPAGYSLGTSVAMPATDAAGLSTLALPIGAYQVCETFAPANIVDKALPFILTVPMPHQKGWVYNVHAYPKNGAGELVKSVTSQGSKTGMGAIVDFPVEMTIPVQAAAWTKFTVSDTFDARLAPVGTGVKSVKIDGVLLDATLYNLLPIVGNKATMELTPAGIAWLNVAPKDSQAGKKIQIVFTTKVIAIGTGVITNDAQFSNGPGIEFRSNNVTSNWGSIEVQKRAAGTTGTQGRLKDAVFEVYNSTTPYAASCATGVANVADGAIAVAGASTFTSNTNGVVTIPGLFVSDSTNAPINSLQRCYVLKEIAAPAGYVLPTNPFTGVTVKAGQTVLANAFNPEIVNTQQSVPELPLTGASGQVLLVAGGAAALSIAVGLMLMNRRRTQAKL